MKSTNNYEQVWYKVSELTKIGLPKKFILDCCHSEWGPRFARKTGPRGIWLINRKKYEQLIEAGYFCQ